MGMAIEGTTTCMLMRRYVAAVEGKHTKLSRKSYEDTAQPPVPRVVG